MKLLYNLGIAIFTALTHLAAPFNSKARLLVRGRKNWAQKLTDTLNDGDHTVWVHCASLGEFEQGRPVIEEIKKVKPGIKIILSFFSSSGYEVRKDYQGADAVIYLPADTRRNALKIIKLINPDFVIFVKYEFWNNFISVLFEKKIPFYLISALFRPDQHFFKWYGSFFRKMLSKFSKIFVQDKLSLILLSGIGMDNVYLAGDTRFDRVVQIAGTAREIPQIEQFRSGEKLFLAGSSWRQDEEIISLYINKFPDRMKWVFAPHEIDKGNIDRIEKLFKTSVVRFSKFTESDSDARVLIIDNIGMLSSAYKYAYVAAIGGGFGRGIHNILEPACWGIPVLFGPEYKKFREAVELINLNGAMTFDSLDIFSYVLDELLKDESFYLKSAKTAGDYVSKNAGATKIIMQEICP